MIGIKASAANQTRLRVLLAARDVEIYRLALTALSHAYKVEHERVESADALRRALRGKEWDVVLCDPMLAGCGCREILASLREEGSDLLMIAVSEEEDEKLIGDLLRAGVRAAIGAARLGRLAPIIAREL